MSATDGDTSPLVRAVALNADNLTTIMEFPEQLRHPLYSDGMAGKKYCQT